MTNITRLKDVKDAEDDEWFSVRGKITKLNPKEDIHEKMEQEGYISDGTAEIRFVDWGDAPEFKEDEVYEFESIVTNKYRGDISISITSSTKFNEITEDDLFDGKPREQIIREIEQMGSKNKPYVDTSKYRVNINDLRQDVEKLDGPLWGVECNLHDTANDNDSTPFWEKYSWASSLPPLMGYNTHALSLYGIDKSNNIVLGKKGTITGVGGSVGLQNRDKLNAVKNLKDVADKLNGLNKIIYKVNQVKWMHLADCDNCGAEFNVKELIGVNPYNPSEDYLSYYDWWIETERHNIDVPECPECGEKELYPPETPNEWHFVQKIPIDENASIDDAEDKIGDELDFNEKIQYTRDKILSLTMNNIVMDLSSEIQNAISDKKTKATGERGVRGITRRYIRLQFNRSLTEDELIEIANCAIKHGEGIGRIKDQNNSMVIDFSFHKNKLSDD